MTNVGGGEAKPKGELESQQYRREVLASLLSRELKPGDEHRLVEAMRKSEPGRAVGRGSAGKA